MSNHVNNEIQLIE